MQTARAHWLALVIMWWERNGAGGSRFGARMPYNRERMTRRMTGDHMSNIKLVAVDEDGTFLRDHKHYDLERFELVFERMRRAGVHFVVATGNQCYQVQSLFPSHAHEIGIVSASGAYVLDGKDEVFLAHASDEAVRLMINACHEEPDVPFAMLGVASTYVERTTSSAFFEDMAQYSTRIAWVDDFADVDDKIFMFSSVVDEQRVEREIAHFREVVGTHMDVTGAGDGYFDVVCPGVNKATGLGYLLERYGVAPEECIAFGDSDNDVDMLRFVGCSYAMQNAPQAIRDVADHVAPPCTEDGVLQVLEELFA